MGKNIRWPVVAAAALAASAQAVQAGNGGEFRISPFLGLAGTEVDGRYQEFGRTFEYDGYTVGISAAWRAPFGLVAEAGTSASGDPYFGWATGGELREVYAAVGYDFDVAEDWRITPKLGWTSWELKAGEIEDLVDDRGEETDSIDGEDPFVELVVARRFGEHIAIGLALRAADVEFGKSRSAAFTLSWTF
jgi:hypothetical protein